MENPSNDVKSFAEGQSFDQILDSAFAEAGGVQPTPQAEPVESIETVQQVAVSEDQKPSAVSEEEFEFEGKKFKIEKSAKDYLLEALNAKKGMRKAFSERDAEKKRIKEQESDMARYKQITDTFKSKGIEGLYDALAAKEGSYQEHLKKRDELAIRKYNATEDELRIIHQEEMLERERNLREVAEKTQKEVLENIQRKEMEANKAILSTRLSEAFEPVSFEGKLGDTPEAKARETKFNRYVWEQARMQLKEYADTKGIAHHEIPSKVIKATFAEIASDFSGSIKNEAASSVAKQAQAGSDAATLAAQARSTTEGRKAPQTRIEALAEEHKNPHSFINALFGKK